MRANLVRTLTPESNRQVTLELRHFVEDGAELFDKCNPYPIWNEAHRAELNQKIIDHFYFREIGFETFGRFKHKLNTKMREIMPAFNERYRTTLFDYNPIENYNMQEEFIDTASTVEKGNSTGESENVNKFSDTPQTRVENIDDGYLKNLTIDKSNGKNSQETNTNSDSLHTGKRRGNIGVTSTQQLIQQERDLIINIDLEIIDALEPLFMGVY